MAVCRSNVTLPLSTRDEKVVGILPHLHEESEIKEAFHRMDHNGDGEVDFTDFLMWQERMQEGRANTDFYALQEVRGHFSRTGAHAYHLVVTMRDVSVFERT